MRGRFYRKAVLDLEDVFDVSLEGNEKLTLMEGIVEVWVELSRE